jgi:hypothetical protein
MDKRLQEAKEALNGTSPNFPEDIAGLRKAIEKILEYLGESDNPSETKREL